MMIYTLTRFHHDEKFTYGYIKRFDKDTAICFTCEGKESKVKIPGKSRIPEGEYFLKLRKEETPLTLKYRQKFPWFKWHIEIVGVPEFTHTYIHIGNTKKDTKGCPLIASTCDLTPLTDLGWVAESTEAFEKFWKEVYKLLESGYTVKLKIRSE